MLVKIGENKTFNYYFFYFVNASENKLLGHKKIKLSKTKLLVTIFSFVTIMTHLRLKNEVLKL